ncbi:xanthine dehydrogenase family protein molybdopterin-binding subunit [Xanthobacteraceae bacterium Astr-EGSB]|uniref:xanthine dehydrogenase family protein molybdopterin-binding subunit n=1 Tax=Astrobacterium formosum TaxID=3069710 RepID=UPI0027B0CEA2|nr:xanthine dehydrogenase family protein molybdopterin-binding subunit [Xanthobacteraceae bacterium Astr-EGSB]
MARAAPKPQANMGPPVPRYDGRAKVTGDARYPSDVPVASPAFAFLVTSAIAKGRIVRMDLAAAQAVPGVLDILTAEDTRELKHVKFAAGGAGASTSIQGLGPDIDHDGQIVAVVLADSFEAAREAAHKVDITYAAEEPAATFDATNAREESPEEVGERAKKLPKAGDAAAALASAEVTIDAQYATPAQHHNAIELFTTTALWSGDELTIYEPSQFVFGLKNNLAERLGIDAEQIRVVSPYVGGAFGSKAQMTPRTALIALAARRLGRPVKLVSTRDQAFTISTYRAETRHRIRMGARRDGRITAFIHEGWELTSRPDPYSVAGVEDSARMYGFGAVETRVTLVHADRNTPGFMRSPPVVPYIYALESAMDELALELGMDPVELRRANNSMRDATGKEWSSRSLMECYDEAAAAFGWKERTARPGSMRDGDWLIGWGCATAAYPTHLGPSAVRVRLTPAGEVRVQVAAHDIGTGLYTVLAQLAADELGVPLDMVRVELGDTALPPGIVAGGSVSTAATGSALVKACAAIRERLTAAPAQTTGGPSGNKLEDVFERLGIGAIEEYAEFIPEGGKPDAIASLYKGKPALGGGSHGEKLMYALGAEFVEVRVHALTREIRVPRIVGAFAAGRIMNTRTARSQLMGGMIWGISSALHEATEIDRRHARYINDNLADYLMPVNADIRDVEVILVPEEDSEVNPIGAKGLGELGNVGTAAAITNAVHHATGVRIRELPVRLEKLLG